MTHRISLASQVCGLAVTFVILTLIPLIGNTKSLPEGPLLVVSAPWQDLTEVVSGAGGHLVGPEQALFGSLVTSDHPDFAERLQAQGVLVLRSGSLAYLLCGGGQ